MPTSSALPRFTPTNTFASLSPMARYLAPVTCVASSRVTSCVPTTKLSPPLKWANPPIERSTVPPWFVTVPVIDPSGGEDDGVVRGSLVDRLRVAERDRADSREGRY